MRKIPNHTFGVFSISPYNSAGLIHQALFKKGSTEFIQLLFSTDGS